MASALDYLRITPPGNPLSAFFPQQGGDDALRSQLEERPQGRSQIPPELAIASQLPDPSGFLQQVQQFRGQNEAKQAIQGLQGLDFGKPEYAGSVAKLLSKYPNAAQNPAVQKILQLKEFSGKQAADTKYSSAAAQAAKDLLSIPEDDPNYDEKYQKLITNLDPEVLTHPRFASFAERGMHNSAMVRSKRTVQQQEKQTVEKEARRLGIKPSKYDNLDDLNDAIADKMGKAAQKKDFYEFFQRNPEVRKEYAGVMSKLRAPTQGPDYDQEKMEAVGKTRPQDMTAADWIRGDSIAKQNRLHSFRAMNDQLALMGVNPLAGMGDSEAPEPVAAPGVIPAISGAPAGVSVPSTGTPQLSDEEPGYIAPSAVPLPAIPVAAPQVEPEFSPSPPSGFAGIQQSRQQEADAKLAAQEQLAQKQQQLSPQWEKAKNEIASMIGPAALERIRSGIPLHARNLAGIVNAAGHDPDEEAFKDESGKPVTWFKVAQAATEDPRLKNAPIIPQKLQAGQAVTLPGGITIKKH